MPSCQPASGDRYGKILSYSVIQESILAYEARFIIELWTCMVAKKKHQDENNHAHPKDQGGPPMIGPNELLKSVRSYMDSTRFAFVAQETERGCLGGAGD